MIGICEVIQICRIFAPSDFQRLINFYYFSLNSKMICPNTFLQKKAHQLTKFHCKMCNKSIINLTTPHNIRRDNPQKLPKITANFPNTSCRTFDLILVEQTDPDPDSIYWGDTHFYGETWFKDYSWDFLLCNYCNHHVGYIYRPVETKNLKVFYGFFTQSYQRYLLNF